MRTKKILALLSALTVMGALSACGGESSTTADSSSKAETTTAATEATTTAATEATTTEATTAAPLDAPADGAITFDTASLYTAHPAGGGNDEADVELSIEEVDGNAKLKVHVLKADDATEYGVPKIVFDLPALLGEENVGKIGHISIDFYCNALDTWKNDDGTEALVVGNFLGALGGNIANAKGYDAEGNLIQNTWANLYEFACDDWENPTHEWRVETDVPALLPANGYASVDTEYFDADGNAIDSSEVATGQTLFIMRWGQANSVDFYIDNLTFFDKDGNVMEIVYDAESNLAGESAPATDAEGEEAEAETTAEVTTEAAE